MGNCAQAGANTIHDETVKEYSQHYYNRKAPCAGGPGWTRLLIIRIEYKRTNQWNDKWHALDTKYAEVGMVNLAKQCGLEDITVLNDDSTDPAQLPTKENVLGAIEDICGRMDDDDYLIIYYTGHGAQVSDLDGGEGDGKDECWCLIDNECKCSKDTWLLDDDLSTCLSENLPPKGRFLMLSDSCHSGSMCDFDSTSDKWQTHRDCLVACDAQHFHAAALSGCADTQTSAGTGQGGVFSNAMFLAIDMLQHEEQYDYTVATLHNKLSKVQRSLAAFRTPQSMELTCPHGSEAGYMPWPLAPSEESGEYIAPFNPQLGSAQGDDRSTAYAYAAAEEEEE